MQGFKKQSALLNKCSLKNFKKPSQVKLYESSSLHCKTDNYNYFKVDQKQIQSNDIQKFIPAVPRRNKVRYSRKLDVAYFASVYHINNKNPISP